MNDPIAGKRIALAAGGTGGHVYPALAVLSALMERKPAPEILYFGRKTGLEHRLLANKKARYIGLAVRGIPRRPSLHWISGPVMTLFAFLKSIFVFLRTRPHLVIGFGSYVAGPVVMAAVCLRIPTMVHEQNSFPGAANRALAPWVTRVLVNTAETGPALNREDAVVVGIPLRPETLRGAAKPESLSLDAGKKTILIFGGSQGARVICETAVESLRRLMPELPGWQALLITGPANFEWVKVQSLPESVTIRDYVDDMGSAYAAADLVVGRAGAVSLAEITTNGLPGILIPLPQATGGHQLKNARFLEKMGAAKVIENSELSAEKLSASLKNLAMDEGALKRMAETARQWGNPQATQCFIREIEDVLKKC